MTYNSLGRGIQRRLLFVIQGLLDCCDTIGSRWAVDLANAVTLPTLQTQREKERKEKRWVRKSQMVTSLDPDLDAVDCWQEREKEYERLLKAGALTYWEEAQYTVPSQTKQRTNTILCRTHEPAKRRNSSKCSQFIKYSYSKLVFRITYCRRASCLKCPMTPAWTSEHHFVFGKIPSKSMLEARLDKNPRVR